MPSHTSLPTTSAGSGPQSPPTANAFGVTGSAANAKDELRESVDLVPESGEALTDRAAV